MKIKIDIMEAGYCKHIKKFALRTAPWRCCNFPALFALIQHPDIGNILFDTGYSDHFFRATRSFPFQLYRWITPVNFKKENAATEQLFKLGISPDDIAYIFISHFHADHIGALRDFKKAKFIYSKIGYDYLKELGKFRALHSGFISALLPEDFELRSQAIEASQLQKLPHDLNPFEYGYQIFDDPNIHAIELPGHANGQYGLSIKLDERNYIFFIGDACWSSKTYRTNTSPHWLSYLIMADKKNYKETLSKLNRLHIINSSVKIIPSHCDEILVLSAK